MSWPVCITSLMRCTSTTSSRRIFSGPTGGGMALWWPRRQRSTGIFARTSHYTALHPGEAELIDAELIRATCLVGTAEELIEQMRELERQGLQELMFATGNDEKWRFAEAFSRQVMARL